MRYIWISNLILLFLCSASLAQTDPYQQINEIFTLGQQGQFNRAIAVAEPLIASRILTGATLGKTWALLGTAYVQESEFRKGQNAFEQAARLFEGKPECREDYAAVLDSLADLYIGLGQKEVAVRLETKAFEQYKLTNDHASLMKTSSSVAGLLISLNKISEGKKYLQKAVEESKSTDSADEDNLATLSAMQGQLAAMQHEAASAVSNYQRALDLWKHRHGEDHAFTGWGHVLVGRALADTSAKGQALEEMRSGLSILDHALGRQDPKYLAAQIAYAYVLKVNGLHSEATQVKTAADQALKNFYRSTCASCTISVTALR